MHISVQFGQNHEQCDRSITFHGRVSDMDTKVPERSHSSEFASAIRNRRRELGLTQHELALAVGTDRRVIGRLERGIGTVRLEVALRAAHELGLDYLPRAR
jgi:DNA-binding XRE family transcriptional regulator